MFIKLAEVGKAVSINNTDSLSLFYQHIGPTYTKGIRIIFSDDGTIFKGCQIEKFEGDKAAEIPYKKGPSNGFDPLPVTKMSAPLPNKPTFKVFKRMSKYINELAKHAKDPRLQALKRIWIAEETAIQNEMDMEYMATNTDKDHRVFFFISLGEKELWEFDEVKAFFKEKIKEGFQNKDKIKTVAQDQFCAICGERKAEVYGNVTLVQSYNLDQPGFISGGANASMGVKNLPICFECAGYLSKGFDYVKNHLSFNMGGLDYLLIPSVTGSYDPKFLLKTINTIQKRETEQTLKEAKLQRFVGQEDLILRKISREYGTTDQLELTMVFYKKSNSMWRIRAEIPRILPSHLKKIYEKKEEAEQLPFLKKGKKPDHISMGIIKDFSTYKDNFLTYVEAIFGNKRLEYKKVLKDVVNKIVNSYKSSKDAQDLGMSDYLLRHGVLLLDFLDKLGIITFSKGENMDEMNMPGQKYVDFMNEYQRFFNTPGKRVAFLTGLLIAKVLYFQEGSNAFRRYLGDYRFDLRKLKSLRPHIEAKIAAYDRDKNSINYTRDLRALLDLLWARVDTDHPDTDDNLTLAVIMGMNLDYYLSQKYQKEENNE